MRRIFYYTVLGATLLSAPVFAQSYADGEKAYAKGDYAAAFRTWQPLAEKGDAKSQFNVGSLYMQGHGVGQSGEEAIKWWKLAAAQNLADAQLNLARLYANGMGVDKNPAESAKWYRKAADQGNVEAQTQLGALYVRGEGVAKSDKDAVTWFRKAIAQGSTPAMFNMGAMYENGQGGLPQDKVKAYTFFTLAVAASTGKEAANATASRDRVATALKPDDIKNARAVASKCMQANYKNCAL